MKQNNEKSYDNVEKTVICYDILMKFEYLLKNYYESNKCNIYNKLFLFIQLFTTNFILKLFYGDLNENFIENFINSSFKYVASNKNISNDRTYEK